jgi:hypothetical protein
MIHLLKALPHRLSDSDHVWDFNCFETVAVLGSSKFRFKIRPDDNFGPFTVSMTMTNGDEAITLAATARDAFSRIVPAWYRDATEEYVPVAMKDARIILTAEFFRWHCLPMRTTEATLEGELWTALRSDWIRAGVIFPQEFEVILYHTANLQMVCTSHTGLLFAGNSGGFTYLEKAGGKGPFVRLDVDRKSDLFPWMKATFDDRTQRDGRMFVSFNDTEILKLNSK